MQKTKWALARFIFLILAAGTVFTGGLLGYLLCPLYSWYFFNDINFWKYHQYLPRLVSAFWRQAGEWFRNPQYRRMFAIPWASSPMNNPDSSLVRVSGLWRDNAEGCGECVKCCAKIACPLHDINQKRCKSYGSFFWRYFNCGRYPANVKQINYYECEKWETCNFVSESE